MMTSKPMRQGKKTLMDAMPPLVFFLSTRYPLTYFSSFLQLPASFLLHTNTLHTLFPNSGYGKAHACASVQQLRWRTLCLKGCLSTLSLRWPCCCIVLLGNCIDSLLVQKVLQCFITSFLL